MNNPFPDEFYTAFGVALPGVLADWLNRKLESLQDVVDQIIKTKEDNHDE